MVGDDVMSTQNYTVCFSGQAFSNNVYDLHLARQLRMNLRVITEKMVAVCLGRNELVDELSDSVAVKDNALEVDIHFSDTFFQYFDSCRLDSAEGRFVDDIARLYFNAMTLRKFVAEATNVGKSSKILINTDTVDSRRSVTRTEKGNILLSHPKVLWTAQMTKKATDAIIHLMKINAITHFEVAGLNKPFYSSSKDVVLSEAKADLMATATLRGRLDNLFFSKRRGVVVTDKQVYQIAWDNQMKNKLIEHADVDDVEFVTQPSIETHSVYGELMVYKVLECRRKKQKIFKKEQSV